MLADELSGRVGLEPAPDLERLRYQTLSVLCEKMARLQNESWHPYMEAVVDDD